MTRSKNSRRGATNKHSKRHKVCHSKGCPYCLRNLTHAVKKQQKEPHEDS